MEKTFTVTKEPGIHARAATLLVHGATKFESNTNLVFEGKTVNLKSIMDVIALGIPNGSEITIVSSGSDETEALAALTEILKSYGFGR